MERIIPINTIGISGSQQSIPVKDAPEIKCNIKQGDNSSPVRIGKLLEPIQQIIDHPDRDRLMAELFKDYK